MPKQKQDIEMIELTEENIESMVYTIRNQKVMLDFDLARIYGYETKRFNEQVKNNIEKFPEDFMFELTKPETLDILRSQIATAPDDLRSKKSTANELSSKRRYNPYAFTEQGIYMLMTVLKGDLATKQSIALIKLFKRMKNYLSENRYLLSDDFSLINDKFSMYDKHFEIVDAKLDAIMDNFIDPSTYKHILISVGEKVEAEVAYQKIYSLAKKSIYIIDDYISIHTLTFLKNIDTHLRVIIFSDNVSRNRLTIEELAAFNKEYNLNVKLYESQNMFHDRYVVLDYKEESEVIYHSGASSKDAGNKICTIDIIEKKESYHPYIDELLSKIH